MDVTVERDCSIGVAQYLRKTLDLKTDFHASGSEGVSDRVKVNALKPALFRVFGEPLLNLTRFHELFCASQKKSARAMRIKLPAEPCRAVGKWDHPGRSVALGTADDDLRLPLTGMLKIPYPLHGGVHFKRSVP